MINGRTFIKARVYPRVDSMSHLLVCILFEQWNSGFASAVMDL